jgi:hypothetical protein
MYEETGRKYKSHQNPLFHSGIIIRGETDGRSFTPAKHTWKWSWDGPTDEFSFCHNGLFKMPFATAAAVLKSWERVVSLYSLRKLTSYIFKHWIINDDVSDHNNVGVVTNDVQRITWRSYATTCMYCEWKVLCGADAGEARGSAI